jgi:hypothetical protein
MAKVRARATRVLPTSASKRTALELGAMLAAESARRWAQLSNTLHRERFVLMQQDAALISQACRLQHTLMERELARMSKRQERIDRKFRAAIAKEGFA